MVETEKQAGQSSDRTTASSNNDVTSEGASTTSPLLVSKLACAVKEGTDRAVRVASEPFKRTKTSARDDVSVSTPTRPSPVPSASQSVPVGGEGGNHTKETSEEGAIPPDAEQTHARTGKVDDTNYELPTITLHIRDSKLAIASCAVVSLYLTYRHWYVLLSDGMIPPSAGISWVVFAFVLGRETKGTSIQTGRIATHGNDSKGVSLNKSLQSSRVPSQEAASMEEQLGFFGSLVRNVTGKVRLNRYFSHGMKIELRSNLQKLPSSKFFWKDNIDISSELMKSLLQNPKLKRHHVAAQAADDLAPDEPADSEEKLDQEKRQDNQLGFLDIDSAGTARKQEGDTIIEPMFHLRGIDVFLTDGNPEEKIWELPALKKCGLRSVPTFVINCLLPWSNFVVYFEMPEWFKDIGESLEVKDDDTADIKSLKLFLKGSSEYRTKRFTLRPCLVEGPLPIRIMASPGEDYEVGAEYLPMSWHLVRAQGGEAPLLGLDIDATSDKVLRSAASLAKRYLNSISIDVGAVIEDDDAACCLGLWRMNRIDAKSCPALPERSVEEDTMQASQLKSMSQSQMVEVAAG